jgi:regulator of protease activity HflC (stomatin/prohibitin superfamily)
MTGYIIAAVVVILVIWILAITIRIVPQAQAYVIETLGKYSYTWQAGFHLLIPFIQRVSQKVSLKEQCFDFPPQPVITKDNVTMQVDSVVYAMVFDPKLYTYGVNNPVMALEMLTATTLRNIIGDMELDETLTSREAINTKLGVIVDKASDPWGIKVTRIEIKNIAPPSEIVEVMSKQVKAERERRQTVLEAQAHKEAVVSRAEGDKQAKVLNAEAERDAQVSLAEGRARSIELVYEAEAEGLKKLEASGFSDRVLRLKGIEALKDVSDGRATKIYLPTDLSSVITKLGVAGEALGIGDNTPIDKTPKPEPEAVQDECCPPGSSVTQEIRRTEANDIKQFAKDEKQFDK